MANGFVIYRGPSTIDGVPIVAIATVDSANRKNRDLLQTWILPESEDPVSAAHRSGADVSVCGNCPLRPLASGNAAGGCYVNKGQAPLAVYRAYRRGSYLDASGAMGVWNLGHVGRRRVFRWAMSKPWRLGSYGEPVAVPWEAWDRWSLFFGNGAGYTHRWASLPVHPWARYVMASVHSVAEAAAAQAAGWRTFRTGDDDAPGEVICPAYTHGTTCDRCGLCGPKGYRAGAPSVRVPPHGSGARMVRSLA